MRFIRTIIAAIGVSFCLWAQLPDFRPPTPLLEAVLQGDEAGVNRLLAAGANPNEGEFLGETPLLLALMRNSPA